VAPGLSGPADAPPGAAPDLIRRARFHATLLLARGLTLLPRRAALAAGGLGGILLYHLLPAKRRQALENLRASFPERDGTEIAGLARASFAALGRNSVDVVRLSLRGRASLEGLVGIEGLEHFERAARAGRGIVAATAHAGAWEILPAVFAARGYRVNVVARPVREERWNAVLRRIRERDGIRVLPAGRVAGAAIQALRRGEVVGLLADARPLRRARAVAFFGRPAPTGVGPHALARRTGAALLPVVVHLDRNARHVVRIGAPIEAGPAAETLRDLSAALESHIREAPAQWVWMYHRWRERRVQG
jgi:KDO2-lipid IV(A) lauroyltransferase